MQPWAAYRFLDSRGCPRGALVCLLYLALALPVFAANPSQLENAKPGTTDWQITNLATKGEIEGYASQPSVNRGGQIVFYVNTSAPSYTLEVFRLGWYGGMGGRRMTPTFTIQGIQQPPPTRDLFTGLAECNWIPQYLLNVPANPNDATEWASGVYVIKLTRTDTGKQRYIIFVVRDDSRASGFLYAANVITYQAHNNWGGKSLQESNSMGGRARKISFSRPYAGGPADDGAGDFLGGSDYNAVRFLERDGYDLTYATDLDLHRDPALPLFHRAVLFGGSSRYWSWQIRSNLLAARGQGINLGFFSAGNGYWQVRLEPSAASGAPDRTIVAYKQDAPTEDPFALDSDTGNDHLVAGRWRDVPLQRGEESLIGGMLDPGHVSGDMVISNASHWAFANSGLSNGNLLPGLLGQEVDRSYATNPSGTEVLAHSPYTIGSAPTQFSDMTVYTTTGGAVVFAAGTSRWPWALDDYNAPAKHPSVLNAGAQQITRNVLARFLGPNFRLTANPGSIATGPGETSIVSLTLTPLGGYSGNVQLSLTGLPPGANYAFSPTSISTSGSALLAFATDPATPTGSYTLRITGTDGSITHSATVTLLVLNRIPRAGWRLRRVDSQEIGCFSYPAIRSFDGDPTTFWHTQICSSSPPPHPHEIDIELGGTYELRGFRYLPRQDGCSTGWISGYEFYVSHDGWVWTRVSAGTFDYGAAVFGCAGNSFSGAKSVSFPPVTANYVRLRSLSEVSGQRYASMAELDLLGGLAGNLPPDGAIMSPSQNITVYASDWVDLAGAGWDNDSTLPLRFNWSFGEGAGLADMDVEDPGPMQFLNPGVFDVTMFVTDALGAPDPTPALRSLTVLAPGGGPLGPATPAALTLFDSTVVGGNGSEGIVTLSGPAPAGTVVSPASSDPATATVPASVDLTQGVSSTSFTISTSQVMAPIAVTIWASAGGTAQAANLTVQPATIVGLTLQPAAIIGSTPVNGAVTINAPAPAGGASVALASDNPAASVPASVIVPAGATSATFTVLTSAVPAATQVTISASYGGNAQLATLDITPPTPSLLVLSPFTLTGGTTSRASLSLTGPAPAGGLTVSLSSGDSAVASVPSSVTVPANSTSASFFVQTTPVATNQQVLIQASYAGVSKSATLTVKAPTPTDVTLDTAAVIGGNTAQATVTLTGPAPSGGTVVTLTTNDAAATVPASVKVNAGSSSASFTVSTNPVASAVQVVISATASGVTKAATLDVNPATPNSLILSSASVIGGTSTDATVTLNGPAPSGGLAITLGSSDSAVAAVPASVSVPAGSSSATFVVSSLPVGATQQVTISASFGGVTQSATLDVQPASLMALGLNPATLIGGSGSEATVSLDGPAPTGGMIVALTSSDPAIASVPSSVTVPANSSSAIFNIATTPVSAFTQVTISATCHSITRTAKISVKIATPSALTLSPAAVIGGTNADATVTLNGPAPSGGTVVLLASSDATSASVPASVTVPAGATTAQFTTSTIPVGTSTQVTLSATYKGTTQTATLDIAAATPSTLALSPLAVVGGSTADATLTLTGPAPAAGTVVLLSSSDSAAASVPASVVVPPGADTAIFSVSTAPVWAWTQVTVSASYGGVAKTAKITVKAAVPNSFDLDPAAVIGGNTSQATVTLTGPAPQGGGLLTLSSSDPQVTVPASVTVPEGSSSATFTVGTSPVNAFSQATLSATYNGVSRTAKISIKVASPDSLTLSPSAVIGGSTADATIFLNGVAPSGGTVVNLASSDTSVASVPGAVTVPAGASSATFTISTVAVGATVQATISATAYGVSQTATLDITTPTPSALTLDPAIVIGGSATQATLTLNGPAPAAGAVVSLASTDPAAAFPASVTVSPGATTATFAVTTIPVATYTHVDISASGSGVTQTASLGIKAPAPTGLSLDPSIVVGGRTADATVKLSGPAPWGGVTLTVSSADPAVAAVPSTVTVPAGATSATFSISTTPVSFHTQVAISVTNGSVIRTAKITVKIATPISLVLTPNPVVGGNTLQATVTLNGPAPSNGTVVRIGSGDAQLVTVPATVTVPAGASSATFTVNTATVTAFTQVILSATVSGVTSTAKLSLKVVSPSAVTLSPATVIGGSNADASVMLNGPAPAGGMVVALASDNASVVNMPGSITMPEGASSASFTVTTLPVDAPSQVTISASTPGFIQSAVLEVDPPAPAALALSPTSVVGGGSSQATVTLNGPAPAQGVTLTVSTSDASAAAPPATVTVPAGATSASFAVATNPVGALTQVTISVSDRGIVASAALNVLPATVSSLTVSPSWIIGGNTAQGTVTLNGAAPAGGTVIALASSDPATASVPSSVTVPAGATSATFAVPTNEVFATKSVTLFASKFGVTKSALLSVKPPSTSGGGGAIDTR